MERLGCISDEQWEGVNKFNRNILDEFLDNSVELSPRTIVAYKSNLRIWFYWIKENCNNKTQIEIKPLEFKRFQNWLQKRGSSSSDVYNKRAAVSSLNNYIETYYADEYPLFRNFINKSIKRPSKNFVYEKQPLTKQEYSHLIEVLKERSEWQKIAYLKFTLDTGCRRAESMQVLKQVVNSKPIVKKRKVVGEDGVETEKEVRLYQSNAIRCKGSGQHGKVRTLYFSEETKKAFDKWLEIRGEDECPYMFVTKYKGQIKQASITCFNYWASNDFAEIVGRRFHPHIIRESRATQLVKEDGVDIKTVQKLFSHQSSSTTEIYVIDDEENDIDDAFF